MINLSDYLMGRTRDYPLSDEQRTNALETVQRVNSLLVAFGEDRAVRSGWRPPEINSATPNAAPRSKHMTCQACDLDDVEGDLDEWCLENQSELERIGLWLEHPSATKSWCHVQTIPPKSGKRVFYP